MNTIRINTDIPDAIDRAKEVLRGGGLIAFPTDTVYGIASLVNSPQGIHRLYEAKSRSTNKAIAVLIGELDQLELLTTGLPPSARRLAKMFWPGALTLVIPKSPDLPANLSPLPTVGVRMPDHSFARALIRACGVLATSSANISGEANTITAEQVYEQLVGRIELILDGGAVSGGIPSSVVDCTTEPLKIIREGAISAEVLLKAATSA